MNAAPAQNALRGTVPSIMTRLMSFTAVVRTYDEPTLRGTVPMPGGAPPHVDAGTAHIYKLLSSYCLNCHLIDGVGGKEGPALTTPGKELDASTIEQRIIDPTMLDPAAEMPPFGEKLSPEDIKLLAAWLAKRK